MGDVASPMIGLRDDGINLGQNPIPRAYVLWKSRVYEFTAMTYGSSSAEILEIDAGFWEGETTPKPAEEQNRAGGRDAVVGIINTWLVGEG